MPPWTTMGGTQPQGFLIFDSWPQDPRRILVFATHSQLRQLCNSPEWYADRNFKMAPNIYMQLYEGDYGNMLQAIAQRCVFLGIVIAPTRVMIDFELAMHNAVRNQFGVNVSIKGCFFNLCQSTYVEALDRIFAQAIDPNQQTDDPPIFLYTLQMKLYSMASIEELFTAAVIGNKQAGSGPAS